MDGLPFIKMHGLGNDFVVLDARSRPLALSAATIRRIGDRRLGVGFDQLLTLEPSDKADVFLRIHNSDGSEVGACGNGTRCVASRIMAENGSEKATIETNDGILATLAVGADRITVDMGLPALGWRDIPLAREMDSLHVDLAWNEVLADPVGVGMGVPHLVYFVPDAEAIDLARAGPVLEHDPLLPVRANVSAATIEGRDAIRLRVWERGAGLTLACGTGACAALVAASRRGLVDRSARVRLDGGTLEIEWRSDDHVIMTGPVATSYAGHLDPSLVAEVAP